MSNIVQARIQITGTRPLLWHAFGPDALPLEKQERSGVAGNNPEEWRSTVLVLPATNQLYIKDSYVFGCLRDGARHTRRKRSSLQPYIVATLQVVEPVIPTTNRVLPPEPLPTDPTQPVYLDVQSVKNPGTKARNLRYRVAAAAGWHCAFTIQWDKTVISRAEMEAVALDAGRLCGLGDGRNIGYGRFTVERFEVFTDAPPVAAEA